MKKETFICSKHIKDKEIKKFISDNGAIQLCKYCKKEKHSVSISDLANYIEECIEIEYDDPYSRGAPYNKEAEYYEDRFPGVSVYETTEILEDEIEVDDWQVIEDLSYNFGNGYWAEIDGIWGPTKSEYMKGGWESFKKILKHKIRFLFFSDSLKSDFDDEYGESLNPYFVLDEVGKGIKSLNLFRNFPKGKLRVFRGRQHKSSEILNTAHQLGSPPPNIAKANRMSPAGISMFYGAFDVETCEKEIEDVTWSDSTITTGKFKNLKPLTLIDFTKINSIPSLFDEANRHNRAIARFLKSFIRDLSVPVKPDDSVHIDYIPTQVVTEYLRVIVGRANQVDGIIYNSVKNPNNKCVVLFVENNEITDLIKEEPDKSVTALLGLSDDCTIDIREIHTLALDNKALFTKKYDMQTNF